ncbi:hypothetical protein AwDysgo_21400 [Bacteroidales bacterium]|nr:hypothetical protein AwDysgo_21400 [Bacteroidales bacterium]
MDTQYTALCTYCIFNENKYIFVKEKVGPSYTFDVKLNSLMIPNDEISKNPQLLPNNPGY